MHMNDNSYKCTHPMISVISALQVLAFESGDITKQA